MDDKKPCAEVFAVFEACSASRGYNECVGERRRFYQCIRRAEEEGKMREEHRRSQQSGGAGGVWSMLDRFRGNAGIGGDAQQPPPSSASNDQSKS
eukprot:EC793070.1.p3 GENE.EC793070.1~~EC793070.1.p3  ORF type:complete len:95 (+),score=34.82 EC793070.1:128-412(+)